MQLYETYRPTSFDGVVGQDALMHRLLAIHRGVGLMGQAFWLCGPSGTGKTTVARLIAEKVADPFDQWEIDAQDLNVDQLQSWKRLCATKAMMGKGRAFIVNEAHGLNSRVVSRLQTVLEDTSVQKNSTWLFTTTTLGQRRFDGKFDACPFLSRCICLELKADATYMAAAASRLREIAGDVSMDGQPLSAYRELIEECKGNFRQALQHIASGGML